MRLLVRRAERHRHQQMRHLASHARGHREAGPAHGSVWRPRGPRTGGPRPYPSGHPLTDEESESELACAAALEDRAPQALVPGGGAMQTPRRLAVGPGLSLAFFFLSRQRPLDTARMDGDGEPVGDVLGQIDRPE